MNGVIIILQYFDESCFKSTVETVFGQSIFMSLFNDILNELAPYYWLCPDSPFSSNYAKDENELEFFYSKLTVELNDIYEPYSFFPEYARWIRDDNNWLFGFAKKPDRNLIEKLYREPCMPYDLLLKKADVIFCNEDAAYWECYTRNNAFLNKCMLSVRKKVSDEYIKLLHLSERKIFYRIVNE